MQNKHQESLYIVSGLFCSIVTAVIPYFIVPSFRKMFESFGVDLSAITLLFIEHTYIFFVIPAIVLLVGLGWPTVQRRGLYACMLGTTSLLWGTGILVLAMYLPMSKFSAAA
jgi:type II secretory pathway component PulF